MKVDVKKLSKEQLIELLNKFNLKMAEYFDQGYKFEQTKRKYLLLKKELQRRRENNINEAPEIIRRDKNNQFGVINKKYYELLNEVDSEIYINWKWVEL